MPIVLHLADHDPGGVDMTRQIRTALELYAGQKVEVKRLALNMDQVREFQLQGIPTKKKDKNTAKYEAAFGPECWELDALPLGELQNVVKGQFDDLIVLDVWEATQARLADENETLSDMIDRLAAEVLA